MPHLRVKIQRQKLTALYAAYNMLAEAYEPDDEHEALLYEHICELWEYLSRVIGRGNESNTLKLTSVQALAFCQLWNMEEAPDHYVGTTINRIVADIDRIRKSPANKASE